MSDGSEGDNEIYLIVDGHYQLGGNGEWRLEEGMHYY